MHSTLETSHQSAENQSSEQEHGGLSMAPPTLNLTAGPLQRVEADSNVAQLQDAGPEPVPEPVAPVDDFANLDDDHRDPLRNSNTSQQNLVLLIEQWEASDDTNDDRKLAHIIATTIHESGHTFQSINENLTTGYFPSGYAPTGYWGRGFVQLTHEYNYENMGDEEAVNFNLEDHRAAAILPTISSYVTSNGMIDGDFTTRALNRYLPVTTNDEGERVEGNADWFNARRVVNGVGAAGSNSHDAAQSIGDTAESIYGDITTFRTGITDESIAAGTSLSDYLFNETDTFNEFHDSDALRITEALGHMDFQTPNMASGTDMQQEYQTEVEAAGNGSRLRSINNQTERNAIKAFQETFNQNHHLETPLPETGTLDDRTYEMMMLGGNRIASGNVMIEAAFEGDVDAINLYEQALQNHQAGELSMNGLALQIFSYMPAHEVNDVLNIFTADGVNGLNFAYALARAGNTHDRLATVNPEVLQRMHTLLSGSDNPGHAIQTLRVNAVVNYRPVAASGEFIIHTVERGQTLGAIANLYGMTYQALGQLNDIPSPYNIAVGQELNVPNPEFDPDAPVDAAPEVATTIEPLVDNGPEPETTPTTGGGGATNETINPETVAPETATPETNTPESEGAMDPSGAIEKGWEAIKSFLASIFGG